MTLAEIDLRVGGTWRYVMIASEGFEVGFNGEFREIVPNERIVNTEAYEGMPDGDPALNTITFTEVDGRTTLTMLCEYASKEVRDIVIDSGMESWHAGGDGPARAGRGLAALSAVARDS